MTTERATQLAKDFQDGFDLRAQRDGSLKLVRTPDQYSSDFVFQILWPNSSFGFEKYVRGQYETDREETVSCRITVSPDLRKVWTDFVEGAMAF